MFRPQTQGSRGFSKPVQAVRLIDSDVRPDDVLDPSETLKLNKVQPFGTSTKRFIDYYQTQEADAAKVEVSGGSVPFPSENISAEAAWANADSERRSVQAVFDRLTRAEPTEALTKVYTPKYPEYTAQVEARAADAIQAAIAVVRPTVLTPSDTRAADQPTTAAPATEPTTAPATAAPLVPVSSGIAVLDTLLSSGTGIFGYFLNDGYAVGPVVLYSKGATAPVSVGNLSTNVGPVYVNGLGRSPFYFASHSEIGNRQITPWNMPASLLRAASQTTIPVAGSVPITAPLDVNLTYGTEKYTTTLTPADSPAPRTQAPRGTETPTTAAQTTAPTAEPTTAIVIGPARRTSLPPLTRAEYKSAFDEAYAAQTAVVTTSTSVAASVPPTEDATATITSINVILFSGMNVQRATTIYSDALTRGVYPALRNANLKETELGKSVRSTLLSDYNFDPTMCDIHENGINASVAYMLLQNNPIRNYTDAELKAAITAVNTEYVKSAADFIHVMLFSAYWLTSRDARFQPWLNKPAITGQVGERTHISDPSPFPVNDELLKLMQQDEHWAWGFYYGKILAGSKDTLNNPMFHLTWLAYIFNRGFPLIAGSVAVGLSTFMSVNLETPIEVFMAFATGTATTFFTTKFYETVVSFGLNAIGDDRFRNILFSAGFFSMVPILSILAALYSGYREPYLAASLAQVLAIFFRTARERGNVQISQLTTIQVRNVLQVGLRAILAKLGRVAPPIQAGTVVQMAERTMGTIDRAVRDAADQGLINLDARYVEYSDALDLLGGSLSVDKNRGKFATALSSLMKAFGIPVAEVDVVIRAMSKKGKFQFRTQDAQGRPMMWTELVRCLDDNKDVIQAFLDRYFGNAGQANIPAFRLSQAVKFLKRFQLKQAALPHRLDVLAVIAVMYSVDPVLLANAVEAMPEEAEDEEPGVNRDAFANEIIKFTPDWSLDHIGASDMPANLRWFAYARRRKDIMDAFSAIFQAMGATKADTDAALNSLVNNGGFRSNGRHGSYPDFVSFLTKYSDAFKTFFARYPVDQRIQYGAIFCSRFFGLRGRTVLISKIFGLTYSDYRKLAQQTVPIDPVKMDFTWQDGERPSGPEPTAAQLSAYERPTRRPVSRGGEL